AVSEVIFLLLYNTYLVYFYTYIFDVGIFYFLRLLFCSCGTKVYSGLKLQSPCLFATGRPNLTADFYTRVNKSLQCG
ncbi:hypothetical protein Gogos_006950, partial [Gossypium gossypioides]|nr:hypothetical protein [Gossypium gossypioides]